MMIPIFGTNIDVYRKEIADIRSLYLTISDDCVIAHKVEGPYVIGRFENEDKAKETLFAAGYVYTGGRFVRYGQNQ